MARRIGLGQGISKGRRDIFLFEGPTVTIRNILEAQGVNVDYGCLIKSSLKVYDPGELSPNSFYPTSYEILLNAGVNIGIECLAETTLKIQS